MGEREAVERPVEEVEWTEEGNLIHGEEVASPLCVKLLCLERGDLQQSVTAPTLPLGISSF